MERTERAAIAPTLFDWSDMGSYEALWVAGPKDRAGNIAIGDVVVSDAKNTFLYTEEQFLAATGIENICVVATHDAVLVAPLHQQAKLKKLAKELRSQGRQEADPHATVFRPWGNYRTLISAAVLSGEGNRRQAGPAAIKPVSQPSGGALDCG